VNISIHLILVGQIYSKPPKSYTRCGGMKNENKRASVSKRKMLGRASVSFFETLPFCGHKNCILQ